jgi:flagellar capping protein FliD
MTKDEAQALTDQIRASINQAWNLLLEAYEQRAWSAMGYTSWEAYVRSEFDISRQRAYQLIDQGRAIRAIGEAAGLSTTVDITERDARDIKPVLDEVAEEIKERVEAGEDPKSVVGEVIQAKREEIQAERKGQAPEEPEIDLVAELEEAHGLIQKQEALIESLSKTDLAKEVADWSDRYDRLEGRLQQQMTTAAEAQRQAQRYATLLGKIRKRLGVEKNSEILEAIR